MNRRRKRRLPFAAYAALIFNAAICLAPFIGARAVSTAYGDRKPQFEATNEALTATSQAIDERLKKLTAGIEGAPREVWAGFIRNELEVGDMTTVDGFMLAAPAIGRGSCTHRSRPSSAASVGPSRAADDASAPARSSSRPASAMRSCGGRPGSRRRSCNDERST